MVLGVDSLIIATIITGIFGLIGIVLTKRMNRLEAEQQVQGVRTKEIHHEVNNNGGSSMKDGVDRAVRLIEKMDLEVKGQLNVLEVKLDSAVTGVANNANNIEHLRDHASEMDNRIDRERRERLQAERGGKSTD